MNDFFIFSNSTDLYNFSASMMSTTFENSRTGGQFSGKLEAQKNLYKLLLFQRISSKLLLLYKLSFIQQYLLSKKLQLFSIPEGISSNLSSNILTRHI